MRVAIIIATITLQLHYAHCQTPQVEQYSVFGNEESFGVNLLSSEGEFVRAVNMKAHDNSTKIAASIAGMQDENYKTIAVLLDEAAGGRCDACRTMLEQLMLTVLDVLKKQGYLEQDAQQGAKMIVPPKAASDAISSMCNNKAYEGFASHITKGCAEFLQTNGTEITQMLNTVMENMEGKGEEFVNDVCAHKLQVCSARPKTSKPSRCQACAETASLLGFQLRRDSRSGLESTELQDAMSLTRRKAKNKGYLSLIHIKERLSELCQGMKTILLLQDSDVQVMQDVCDELFSEDYEDEVVRAFQQQDQDVAGQAICTEVTDACTAAEFAKLPVPLMARNVVPYGPLPITIHIQASKGSARLSPQEKAQRIAKKEMSEESTTAKKKPSAQKHNIAEKSAPPTPDVKQGKSAPESEEEELAALQDFLDEWEAEGSLSSDDQEELLRRTYLADQALLRCFRLNQGKGTKKLRSRLQLLLKTGKQNSAPEAAPDKSASKLDAATKKKVQDANANKEAAKTMNELQDSLGQLSKIMKDKGMDTKTIEKLGSVLKGTSAMSASYDASQKKETRRAAEEAARAAMEVANDLKAQGIEVPAGEFEAVADEVSRALPTEDEL